MLRVKIQKMFILFIHVSHNGSMFYFMGIKPLNVDTALEVSNSIGTLELHFFLSFIPFILDFKNIVFCYYDVIEYA